MRLCLPDMRPSLVGLQLSDLGLAVTPVERAPLWVRLVDEVAEPHYELSDHLREVTFRS